MASDSSSGAVSRGVSWQVDIPKLVTVIARIGMEGLKSLQQSGIDIHTVGCVLALGEIAPASVEFRSALQKSRDEQRKETWWIHSVVEYGTGTNFVVDELLKTRAGENVLALVTGVASVYENEFGTVFTALYDKLNAQAHSTPSLGQLERLRSVCLPLVRKMDFKDRLAEVHQGVLSQFIQDPIFSPTVSALPEPDIMAELVMTLSDISREWDRHKPVLVYHGIQGAAWVIAYSWVILGLPVCMIGLDGKSHAIHSGAGSDSCPIVVNPAGEGSSQILRHIDKPSDVIVLRSGCADHDIINWQISCGSEGVDITQMLCGWNVAVTDRQELGNIIYSVAHELIQYRMSMTGINRDGWFSRYNSDVISTSLERILRLFELRGPFNRIPDWRKAHFRRVQRGEISESIEMVGLDMFSRMITYLDRSHMCKHELLRPPEITYRPSFCVRCSVLHSIQMMAYISSTLAFTDWADHYKMLSSRYLRYFIAVGEYFDALIDWDPKSTSAVHSDTARGVPGLDNGSLLFQVSQICSGSYRAEDIVDSNSYGSLGLNIDGMLLIFYRAVETNLLPGPAFLIRGGEFNLNGDRRTVLTEFRGKEYANAMDLPPLDTTLTPWNQYPDHLRLSVKASLLRDSIELRYRVQYHNPDRKATHQFYGDVSVHNIPDALERLLTTSPCPHSPEHSVEVTQVSIGNGQHGPPQIVWCDTRNRVWHIEENICCIEGDGSNNGQLCRYVPIANNQLAKWAAVASLRHLMGNRLSGHVAILHEKACLACRADQAESMKPEHGDIIIL